MTIAKISTGPPNEKQKLKSNTVDQERSEFSSCGEWSRECSDQLQGADQRHRQSCACSS